MEWILMLMIATAFACSKASPSDPPRPPQSCVTVGSVPYWAQRDAYESFVTNRDVIDELTLFWYHLDPDGAVKPYRRTRESEELVMTSRALGVKVLALVANLPDDEREGPGLTWDPKRVRKVLHSQARRHAHVAELVALARRMHFDGILIDYEALPRSQRDDFTQFVAELGQALRSDGRILAVAIHPKTREGDPRETNGSEAQDWDALALHADQLHFMTYSQHTGDTPGPVASVGWTERVLRYAVEKRRVPRHKIFVGLPLYAEQWAEHDDTFEPLDVDLTYRDVQQRSQRFGGDEQWSNEHASPYLRYRDRNDTAQVVWFENRRSVDAKLAVAAKLGLCNFALWRLGGEDQDVWSSLRRLKLARDGESGSGAPAGGATTAPPATEDTAEAEASTERSGRTVTVHGEASAEVEYYNKFAFEVPEDERDNFMTSALLFQTLGFGDHLFFDHGLRAVLESDGEDGRYYSDYRHRGLYVHTLLLRYERGPFSVFGGRYEPAAGLRSDKAIFFGNYSTNLELEGQLGVGAAAHLRRGDARHSLALHVFGRDTSRLRGEVFRDRARDYDIYGDDGEVGPDSVLVTVDGVQPWRAGSLGYALGAGRQGRGMFRDQDLAFGNVFGGVPLPRGELRLSVDGIVMRHAQGQDENRVIVGGGIGFLDERFYAGAAYSVRLTDYAMQIDQRDRTDHIFELVARYAITDAVIAEAAYQRSAEWYASENALGVAIRYVARWHLD